jgi:hypothetical protein
LPEQNCTRQNHTREKQSFHVAIRGSNRPTNDGKEKARRCRAYL